MTITITLQDLRNILRSNFCSPTERDFLRAFGSTDSNLTVTESINGIHRLGLIVEPGKTDSVDLVDDQGRLKVRVNFTIFDDGNWNVDVCTPGHPEAKFVRVRVDGDLVINTFAEASLASVSNK